MDSGTSFLGGFRVAFGACVGGVGWLVDTREAGPEDGGSRHTEPILGDRRRGEKTALGDSGGDRGGAGCMAG